MKQYKGRNNIKLININGLELYDTVNVYLTVWEIMNNELHYVKYRTKLPNLYY